MSMVVENITQFTGPYRHRDPHVCPTYNPVWVGNYRRGQDIPAVTWWSFLKTSL